MSWPGFASMLVGKRANLMRKHLTSLFHLKGEEMQKMIGAPSYIECSSKTQQVMFYYQCNCLSSSQIFMFLSFKIFKRLPWDCRMSRLSLMRPLRWSCSHQSRKRERRERDKKHALYCDWQNNLARKEKITHRLITPLGSDQFFLLFPRRGSSTLLFISVD